jgi:hypothetical protein
LGIDINICFLNSGSTIPRDLPFSVVEGPGPIFRTFFSTENHFPRKILRNFLEKRFFKTFSAENSIFFQHFWGKIFGGIFRGIFPRKNVRKIGPWGGPQKKKKKLFLCNDQ